MWPTTEVTVTMHFVGLPSFASFTGWKESDTNSNTGSARDIPLRCLGPRRPLRASAIALAIDGFSATMRILGISPSPSLFELDGFDIKKGDTISKGNIPRYSNRSFWFPPPILERESRRDSSGMSPISETPVDSLMASSSRRLGRCLWNEVMISTSFSFPEFMSLATSSSVSDDTMVSSQVAAVKALPTLASLLPLLYASSSKERYDVSLPAP
mmetsp:Transcript_20329/g.50571  ORF Transcript_20329/g.50571 Transcript_20329/m.50571 type:complete len:213 (+) Transcript_20329:2288-2926(+)